MTKVHEFFSAPLYTYGNAPINWKGIPTEDPTTYAHSYRRAAISLVMGELEGKIMDLVRRIEKVDPGSYTFRYPVTSKGSAALPQLFMTNIFVFSEEVESVRDEMAEFCWHLEDIRSEASDQIKL